MTDSLKGTLTHKDAREIIENEGIGYAVQNYCDGDNFKDPKLAALWTAAGKALDAVEKFLDLGPE